MAGFDKVDPAKACLAGQVLNPDHEMPARQQLEGASVVGRYGLRPRSGAASRVGLPAS
jgi:hypothetical protein